MQGQNSSFNSFREAVEIGQGSDSSTGSGMNNQQSSLIPPVENRWLSYESPGEACVSAGNSEAQNFSAAVAGEASGSSSSSRSHGGSMTKEILLPQRAMVSLGGHQMRNTNGTLFTQGSSSSHAQHQSMDLNEGYSGNSEQDIGGGCSLGPNLYLSSSVSPDIAGASSGSSGCAMEGNDGSSGSHCNWGLSCKRKSFEGTSSQSCAGGGSSSSSSFLQPENCAWQNNYNNNNSNGYARNNLPHSFRLFGSSPGNSSVEPQDPRTSTFPSSSANVGTSSSAMPQHESIPFNMASVDNARHLSLRQASFRNSVDLRSAQSSGSGSGPIQTPPERLYGPSFLVNNNNPWHSGSSSRSGVPNSISFMDRGVEAREEASLRGIQRNNTEHPIFGSMSEMRNSTHDLVGPSTSLGIPSSSRVPSSSSNPHIPSPVWIQPHNSSSQNRQRTLELAPWSLFPPADPQPGGRSSLHDPLPPGPSLSRDAPISSSRNSQHRQQPYHRSAFLADRQVEDALNISNSLRALSADADGRRRLISEIRQVLHAMRRGENLQAEDYMLFDPFVYHGMAEMHDRHRDMRLDVDNMSYEELLALGERIGDVNTGLTEETISKLMKHRKHKSVAALKKQPGPDLEPCCICQEEYDDGDDVGVLDCGHDFHTGCVKQWLMHKNLCPICKTTGLRT